MMDSTDFPDAPPLTFFPYTHAVDPFQWRRRPVEDLAGEHDCSLGDWGPYNKRYFGISHLPGPEGVRVDWVVVPELHRRRFAVPAALREAGYLPWRADPDLKTYSYRQQILEKDELYADIQFEVTDPGSCRVGIRLVNRSGLDHDVRLHLAGALQPFATGSWSPRTIRSAEVRLPDGSRWLDALAYAEADVAKLDGCPGLANDARRQGEVLRDGLVDGQGMHWPSERPAEASARYRLPEGRIWKTLQIRALSAEGEIPVRLQSGGETVDWLLKSGELCDPVPLTEGADEFSLRFTGARDVVLDGIALHAAEEAVADLNFPEWEAAPEVREEAEDVEVRWPALPESYRVTGSGKMRVRRLQGDLETCLLLSMHNHVADEIRAEGVGSWLECILPVITVPSGGEVIRHFQLDTRGKSRRTPVAAEIPGEAPGTVPENFPTFGVERLAAVLFTNVVYPVRIKGRNIRHHPPGRWWDSLYTWDCGFIGLGMGEISPRRAVELLNTYLTEEEDGECAYVHHGSPVPVQFYLYFDLWQKTRDRELLRFFYPRLKKYLQYLCGVDPRSPTRPCDHGLLQSWELFYNSGGWDDYPPQQFLTHDVERRGRICPMVVSAHAAASAQIMAMVAEEIGEDAESWDELARSLQSAMERHAWDGESGFYGYVEHDREGRPRGIFRDPESGENFNRGLDGAAPLLAGGCAPERADALWRVLEDETRFMTALGLSTVDMRAPYFSRTGYWNGAVWMPYQYLFFRSALDYGRGAFALKLAERVLACWERETKDAYACFEHFMIDSGRGAGWHHFGGLSSPVLNLFAALAVPGRLTTGFRTLIADQQWSDDLQRLECRLKVRPVNGGTPPVCLICLPGTGHAQATLDGEDAEVVCHRPGLLEVRLKPSPAPQCLKVEVA